MNKEKIINTVNQLLKSCTVNYAIRNPEAY